VYSAFSLLTTPVARCVGGQVFDPCQVLETAFSGNCSCQYERLCVLAKPHQKHWGNKYLDSLAAKLTAQDTNTHPKMTVRPCSGQKSSCGVTLRSCWVTQRAGSCETCH
jgi:Tfp pilus assembly protein PilX